MELTERSPEVWSETHRKEEDDHASEGHPRQNASM